MRNLSSENSARLRQPMQSLLQTSYLKFKTADGSKINACEIWNNSKLMWVDYLILPPIKQNFLNFKQKIV